MTDVHTFRAQASIAACEWGLRCGDTLTQPFCHPRYAEWIAADLGATENDAFDVDASRACLRTFGADCGYEPWECFLLSLGQLRACTEMPGFIGYADASGMNCYPYADGAGPCTVDGGCGLGARCVDGVCRDPLGEGDACTDTRLCALGLTCRPEGTCGRARIGESCAVAECEDGATCSAGSGRCVAVCTPPSPRPAHHLGCTCSSDDDCPYDVSVCRANVCVPRPFVGDACTSDGPTCYGSECDGARCAPYAAGHGPCSGDADCLPGLHCDPWNIFGGAPRLCRP